MSLFFYVLLCNITRNVVNKIISPPSIFFARMPLEAQEYWGLMYEPAGETERRSTHDGGTSTSSDSELIPSSA